MQIESGKKSEKSPQQLERQATAGKTGSASAASATATHFDADKTRGSSEPSCPLLVLLGVDGMLLLPLGVRGDRPGSRS